ncbi:MAG: hypothetical protein MJZ58_04010 [Paludibacteraceae bacterium]|nr:hypothetical protein [Paludibacteraceae bacterium]
MANLEELTNKLYNEGVEKGKAQAQELIAQAEQKAADIVAQAEKKAADIEAKAAAKAAELDKNTRSELKLYAEQSVNALRTEVTNLICGKIVADNVKAATADKAFMQSVILKMVESMAKEGSVTISTKDAEELKKYFAANAKALLDKGVKIEEVKDIKTDFAIAPEKGGYKLTFGDREFVEYFKNFLRDQLIELLF